MTATESFNYNKVLFMYNNSRSKSFYGYYAKIHGGSYQTVDNYEEPTRNGYVFAGWYLDPECTLKAKINNLEENTTLYANWIKEDIVVTYDANGGNFDNNLLTNNINYSYETKTKYSHTPNVDDNGVATGTYGLNVKLTDIVSIPGANNIDVKLWYSTNNGAYAWMAIYPTNITPDSYNTNQSYTGSLWGGFTYTKEGANYIEYNIPSDSAKFYFQSNNYSYENRYYGYYAIITATGYFTESDVSEPTQNGKTFAGWYLDPECTDGNELKLHELTSDTVVYAKWQ